MSRFPLKALGGTIAISVAVTGLGAGPAVASDADPGLSSRVFTATAERAGHLDGKVDANVPPGGSSQITSATIPATTKEAEVKYTPLSNYRGFEMLAFQLLAAPTPGKRLVFCMTSTVNAISKVKSEIETDEVLAEFEAEEQTLFLVRMAFCIQVAKLVAAYLAENPPQPRESRQAASTPCGKAPVQFKEKVTKSGGTYSLRAKTPPKVSKKKSRVKVKCRVVKGSIVMTIKGKKGMTLRKALGTKKISLGIASPPSASEDSKVRVAFTGK